MMFEEKYHPVKSVERQWSLRKARRKRLRVFLDLWEEGYIDQVCLQFSEKDSVLKLLDRVILKLEGASEEELKVLDMPPVEEKKVKEIEDSKNSENKDEAKNEQSDASKSNDSVVEPTSNRKAQETKVVYDGSGMKHSLSIFMRSLPATISRSDVVGVCKRYPGYLRVAITELTPERCFSRRCWATFGSDVNIEDIKWSISNVRIKDNDLSPVVYRDHVINRIRPVNGVTCSSIAMQLDIRFMIELLKKLDEKHQLYSKEESNGNSNDSKENKNNETGEKEMLGDEKEDEKDVMKSTKPEDEVIDLPESNPVFLSLPHDIESIITGLDLGKNEEDIKDYPVVVNNQLMKVSFVPFIRSG